MLSRRNRGTFSNKPCRLFCRLTGAVFAGELRSEAADGGDDHGRPEVAAEESSVGPGLCTARRAHDMT